MRWTLAGTSPSRRASRALGASACSTGAGHGRSEPAERGYSLSALAGDVAAVADDLELERPAVVGFSYGGAVALRYAADHPERVGRLVLVDKDSQPVAEWLAVLPERQRARS